MNSHTTTYALTFAATEATQAAVAGGKGAMLARLFQAGLPAPPGGGG